MRRCGLAAGLRDTLCQFNSAWIQARRSSVPAPEYLSNSRAIASPEASGSSAVSRASSSPDVFRDLVLLGELVHAALPGARVLGQLTQRDLDVEQVLQPARSASVAFGFGGCDT